MAERFTAERVGVDEMTHKIEKIGENVTIILGDCLEVMKTMEDKSVHCVITSPPYNLIREWSGGGRQSRLKSLEKRYKIWYDDNMTEEQYQKRQKEVIKEMIRACRGSIFYNHKIRYCYKRRNCIYHPLDWLREFPIWCEIIWDRCSGGGGNNVRYLHADERIYQIQKPHYFNADIGYTSVWRFPTNENIHNPHPAPFPIELPLRCINSCTRSGDVILDPYMGSGTTGVACIRTGRNFIGIEIEPKYYEIAKQRIEKELSQPYLFQPQEEEKPKEEQRLFTTGGGELD